MFNHIAIIILVNLLLYFKTLRHRFVSDDFTVWKNPPVAKNRFHKLWLQCTGQMKFYANSIQFVRANGKFFVVVCKKEQFEHLYTILIHTAICADKLNAVRIKL